EQDRGFFDTVFPTDPSKRDPGAARQSFADFGQLVSRYPNSPYAADARQRMIYLRNLLADSEVHIARYYMRREAWVAAGNRGRYVVENFPQTPAVPNALAIMIEAYMRLGLEAVANDALRVLVHNFPNYPSLDDEGNFVVYDSIRNRDRSWLNVVSFGLFDRPAKLPPLRLTHPEPSAAPRPPGPGGIGG
ncbi:MAG: outer membrane protein assembly factor BamD, partial [Gammaproteobacteria bacterium]